MIKILLNIFTVLNVLAGVYFAATGLWPGTHRPLVTVIIYLVWVLGFLGLAWALWARQPFARLWTFILYGLLGAGTLYSLISEFTDSRSAIFRSPLAYGLVYLIWFALSIAPIVLMLRPDVKEWLTPSPEPPDDADRHLKLRL